MLTDLMGRIMVTEKAVGEEAHYIFVSLTLEDGIFLKLKNICISKNILLFNFFLS
jgi:hypothetical protein